MMFSRRPKKASKKRTQHENQRRRTRRLSHNQVTPTQEEYSVASTSPVLGFSASPAMQYAESPTDDALINEYAENYEYLNQRRWEDLGQTSPSVARTGSMTISAGFTNASTCYEFDKYDIPGKRDAIYHPDDLSVYTGVTEASRGVLNSSVEGMRGTEIRYSELQCYTDNGATVDGTLSSLPMAEPDEEGQAESPDVMEHESRASTIHLSQASELIPSPGPTPGPTIIPSKQAWIRIQVAEAVFMIRLGTLLRHPNSRLGKYATSVRRAIHTVDNPYTIQYDRNPNHFGFILDAYRTGKLHMPQNICVPYFIEEMDFWGLDDTTLAPCCWAKYQNYREEKEVVENLSEFDCDKRLIDTSSRPGWCRWKLWTVLEYPSSSIVAQVWAAFYVLLVLVSTFTLIVDTHIDFRVGLLANETENATLDKMFLLQNTDSHSAILILELITTLIFSVEIVIRFAISPNKLRMLKDPITSAEAVSLVGQWMVFNFLAIYGNPYSQGNFTSFYTMAVLRVFRVFRLLRLARHYSGLRVFVLALAASMSELLMLGVILCIFIIIFSSLIYYAELDTKNGFRSIPECFWWAVITMTTVGYGDVYPTTNAGYFVGAMCGVFGMLATGLPIPIIATNFQMYYLFNKTSNSMHAHEFTMKKLMDRATHGVAGALRLMRVPNIIIAKDVDREATGGSNAEAVKNDDVTTESTKLDDGPNDDDPAEVSDTQTNDLGRETETNNLGTQTEVEVLENGIQEPLTARSARSSFQETSSQV